MSTQQAYFRSPLSFEFIYFREIIRRHPVPAHELFACPAFASACSTRPRGTRHFRRGEEGQGAHRIDTSSTDDDEDLSLGAKDGTGVGAGEEGDGKEKRVRRKWTPEETQMLVDGCNIVRLFVLFVFSSSPFFITFCASPRFSFFILWC